MHVVEFAKKYPSLQSVHDEAVKQRAQLSTVQAVHSLPFIK